MASSRNFVSADGPRKGGLRAFSSKLGFTLDCRNGEIRPSSAFVLTVRACSASLQQAVESSYRIVRASQMLFLNYPGISRRDKLDVGTSQSGGCYERHIGA